MKDIISDWLEEGFLNIDDCIKEKPKRENPVLPCIENARGENITPKPLFPLFLGEVGLDADFLVEYIEVIQKGLQREKVLKKDAAHDKMQLLVSNESSIESRCVPEIIYDRKNIFLGRTILTIFEMVDTFVSNWSPYYESVFEKNKFYKEAIEFRKAFPNNFCDQSVQAGYLERLDKQIETTPIILNDKQFEVTSYLMSKYYNRKEVLVEPPPRKFEEYIRIRTKFRSENEFQSNIIDYPDIYNRLRKDLYIMEKTLDYNTYEETIILYNNCEKLLSSILNSPGIRESNIEKLVSNQNSKEHIRQHMQFYMPILKQGYNVSCINCNFKNPSIFIVGYGVASSEEINFDPRGIVLCWNIHKYGYPEKIYYMQEIVTCVDISKSAPSLIAVGMRYGLIAVIDLNKSHRNPLVINRSSNVRPTGAIKSIHWITKKYSVDIKVEIILALSVDGAVTIWNLGTKLEGFLLKTIKQDHTMLRRNFKSLLTNTVAGLCMQAKQDADNLFSVGTIEGNVLLIDSNNPDDYIQAKNCHSGAVNDIKWSPITTDVFFTCGTDRCLHIWEFHNSKPSKTLNMLEDIFMVTLSPVKSTLFVALTKYKLHIFDLSSNLHKPIIELECDKESHYTYVTFCPKNNWILTGHINGTVTLYEIVNLQKLVAAKSDPLKDFLLPDNNFHQ